MKDKPVSDKSDTGHALARGALGGIPFIGGVAAEIFNLVITPPLTKRRDQWMGSIADGLKKLEEKVDGFKLEDLPTNESFITTVLHA